MLFGVLMAWVLLLVLAGGQYFYPLYWQQSEPDLKLVLRNGLLLAIRHPFYSLLMLLFQLLLIALSFALVVPVMLLLPGMIALSSEFRPRRPAAGDGPGSPATGNVRHVNSRLCQACTKLIPGATRRPLWWFTANDENAARRLSCPATRLSRRDAGN